jgi:hypothetical protein
MTRHWYAVYTRPLKERKLSALLTKKGIENFCPVVKTIATKSGTLRKECLEPLFKNQVFVWVYDYEINNLLNMSEVSTIAYWKAAPARFSEKEIDLIKQLTTNYTTLTLQKIPVDMSGVAKMIGEPVVAYGDNSYSVNYQSITIALPTLGYSIKAERSRTKEQFIYQQNRETQPTGLLNLFPKRLNSLFFN